MGRSNGRPAPRVARAGTRPTAALFESDRSTVYGRPRHCLWVTAAPIKLSGSRLQANIGVGQSKGRPPHAAATGSRRTLPTAALFWPNAALFIAGGSPDYGRPQHCLFPAAALLVAKCQHCCCRNCSTDYGRPQHCLLPAAALIVAECQPCLCPTAALLCPTAPLFTPDRGADYCRP